MPENKITLYSFINFIADDVASNAQFSKFFTEENTALLNDAKEQMNDGLTQLVGDEYSRIVISTPLKSESKEFV